jgi:hypothetical protein
VVVWCYNGPPPGAFSRIVGAQGARVYIKRDAVSWSPKKAKKSCLHHIDKSVDSSSSKGRSFGLGFQGTF